MASPKPVYQCIVDIEGMVCGSCTASVKMAINSFKPRVLSVEVSLEAKRATICHRSEITPRELADKIEDAGFGATVKEDKQLTAAGERYFLNYTLSANDLRSVCLPVSFQISVASGLFDVVSVDPTLRHKRARWSASVSPAFGVFKAFFFFALFQMRCMLQRWWLMRCLAKKMTQLMILLCWAPQAKTRRRAKVVQRQLVEEEETWDKSQLVFTSQG